MLPKPPTGYLEKTEADTLLTRFVHGGRFDGPIPLPKRIDPKQAGEFIQKVFEGDELNRRQAAQACIVMRFYDLGDKAAKAGRWLDRHERDTATLDRSEELVVVMGELGGAAEQKQAADYYGYLAGKRTKPREFRRLANRFASLGEGADPKSISDPIDARMKGLEPKIATDVDAKVEYKELEPIRDGVVPQAAAAWKRKQAILKATNESRRRQDMARAYLGLEEFPGVDLRQWAMGRLQHEANAGKPDDLAEIFSQILELMMSPSSIQGPGGQKLPAEEAKACVTSCARAIEFYGRTLTDEQKEFVSKKLIEDQPDVLYWESDEE